MRYRRAEERLQKTTPQSRQHCSLNDRSFLGFAHFSCNAEELHQRGREHNHCGCQNRQIEIQPGALQNVLINLTRPQRKADDEVVIEYDKIDNVSYNPGGASTMFKQAYKGSASLTCVCLSPDPLCASLLSRYRYNMSSEECPEIDWMTSPDALWCIGCAASLTKFLGWLTQVHFANLRIARGDRLFSI